jgi:hypothetical protein
MGFVSAAGTPVTAKTVEKITSTGVEIKRRFMA